MSGFSLKELYILEEQFEQYFYTDLNVNIHYVIAATLCPKVATGFPQIGFYKRKGRYMRPLFFREILKSGMEFIAYRHFCSKCIVSLKKKRRGTMPYSWMNLI